MKENRAPAGVQHTARLGKQFTNFGRKNHKRHKDLKEERSVNSVHSVDNLYIHGMREDLSQH